MTEDDGAVCPLGPDGSAVRGLTEDPAATGPRADCVRCGEPTAYPAEQPGATLCPVCTWQEAQRGACSG
ncbi:hypothetical protein [Kitasatospora camelliae]|uniref:Small CPxCG-related zinc finger protein n=1 Tax=Kitasatospora camelliae TaxID=3156397 RepID=A0AAU8K0U5_9ACTN